ncbi:uncharacterized protein LOC141901042 [Tubulanus polymorphus]|uniref:uncharacterized protein LOC141901042 n=1 Tax=Tubulanus polymorphus TaxID=672921 RepID=UPI003DA58B8E
MINPAGPGSKYYESSDSGLNTGTGVTTNGCSSAYSISASVTSIPTFSGSVTILRHPRPESKCEKFKRKFGCECQCSWWTIGKIIATILVLILAAVVGLLVGKFATNEVEPYNFVIRERGAIAHVEGALVYKNSVRFYTPSHSNDIKNVETILDFSKGEIINIDHTSKHCFIDNLSEKELGSLDNVRESLIYIRDKLNRVLWQTEPPVKEGKLAGPVTEVPGGRTPDAYQKCRKNKYPIYSAGIFYTSLDLSTCEKACYPHFTVTSNSESTPVIHRLKMAVIECVRYEPCNKTTTT